MPGTRAWVNARRSSRIECMVFVEVFNLTPTDERLVSALPPMLEPRPVHGNGGISIPSENVAGFVRNLFSMGSMGYDPEAVVDLVTKVTEAAEG